MFACQLVACCLTLQERYFVFTSVVCRRAHDLFTLGLGLGVRVLITPLVSSNSSYVICVCLRVVVSNTYCVFFCCCFVCLRLVFCVPNVASFSGLSILDCFFGFL